MCWAELSYTGEELETSMEAHQHLAVSSIRHIFQPGLMKNKGSATMIAALTQAYRAKDIIYSQYYMLFTAMYSVSTKLGYCHRISLFRGAILLTKKSDVVYWILWLLSEPGYTRPSDSPR